MFLLRFFARFCFLCYPKFEEVAFLRLWGQLPACVWVRDGFGRPRPAGIKIPKKILISRVPDSFIHITPRIYYRWMASCNFFFFFFWGRSPGHNLYFVILGTINKLHNFFSCMLWWQNKVNRNEEHKKKKKTTTTESSLRWPDSQMLVSKLFIFL